MSLESDRQSQEKEKNQQKDVRGPGSPFGQYDHAVSCLVIVSAARKLRDLLFLQSLDLKAGMPDITSI